MQDIGDRGHCDEAEPATRENPLGVGLVVHMVEPSSQRDNGCPQRDKDCATGPVAWIRHREQCEDQERREQRLVDGVELSERCVDGFGLSP